MTLLRRYLSYGAMLGIAAAAMSVGCASQEARIREIDPQADPIFKRMCATMDAAKTFRVRVQATIDRPVGTGQLAQFHRSSMVTVARPDRLRAETESDDGKWSVWYRGRTLVILDKDANAYATEKVPGRIGEMLDYMVDHYDLVIPLADLLAGKTYDSLLANVDSGAYLGLHAVGETECHHLLFRQENIDWQIWIDAGKVAVPRKLLITYTQEPDQPQYIATMDDWDLAPAVSEQTFTFAPSAGAKSVPMSELVTDEEGAQP
ncbi:MAG: DUF2092 domain-containing protein [Phycisphaerae bacterium]|nr:DUF2092 domain-containing protein [Phycisphaerae bacterium]